MPRSASAAGAPKSETLSSRETIEQSLPTMALSAVVAHWPALMVMVMVSKDATTISNVQHRGLKAGIIY